MTIIGKGQTSDNQLFWVADNVIAHDFPDVNSALRDPDGLLAIGGCLSPERLLDAYQRGIFPWFSQGQPILWWSPNPRCVLEPENLKVSGSLRKTMKKNKYTVTFNKSFKLVVRECAKPRRGSTDTWITTEMMEAYVKLHELGYAISVECWNLQQKLVGGLYGVVIGKVFFGESMFSRESDTSKIALIHLLSDLKKKNFRLVDCQVHSKHLQSLGAKPIPRNLFINILKYYCQAGIEHQWPVISELS